MRPETPQESVAGLDSLDGLLMASWVDVKPDYMFRDSRFEPTKPKARKVKSPAPIVDLERTRKIDLDLE